MKRALLLLMALICMVGLTACKQDEVLHLGVNARITGLDAQTQQITVSGTDEGSFLGEACTIVCKDLSMLYCNYENGEVKQLSFQELQVGDSVILEIREAEIQNFLKDHNILKVEQLQLGTQRIY